MKSPSPVPIRPKGGMRLRFPLAAALGLLAGALLPGCSGCSEPSGDPGEGPSTTAPDEAPSRVDPAVVAARAKRPDLAGNRVILIGMDGADPFLLRELVDAGRLPHFKRLMDEGAFGPLRSQQPMLSPLLWTTVATGKYLTEHGVLDFLIRDPENPKKRIPVTSDLRRVEAIWDIVGRYDETVGLVGWLASHPAEKVNGFAVSEMNEPLAYLFNQEVPLSPEGKSWPPDLVGEYQAVRRRPVDIPFSEIDAFLDITEEEYRESFRGEEFTDENRINNLRLIYAGADNFRRVGEKLYRERRPDLFCTYFEAIDATSHNFMAFRKPVNWRPRTAEEIMAVLPKADPDLVGKIVSLAERLRRKEEGGLLRLEGAEPGLVQNVSELAMGADPEKSEKYGGAVDAMYEYHDRILGEYMDLMDENTILVVVSDHGFASSPPEEVFRAVVDAHGFTGDYPRKPPFDSNFKSTLGGARYHHLDGILAFYGKGVRKGFRIPHHDEERRIGARLLDVAPTVMALMGFPRAEDMPGRVMTEAFELDLGVGTVPSYESDRATRLAKRRIAAEEKRRASRGDRDAAEDEELDSAMRELAAVGYVGTAEDAPVRAMLHMAASYMEQERFGEAEEAYREALKAADGQQRLQVLVSLGNLRRKGDDVEEAAAFFEEALEQEPTFVPALVGMARVEEDRRDLEKATGLWTRAMEAAPGEPTIRARCADALRSLASVEISRSGGMTPAASERLSRALEVLDATLQGPKGNGMDPSALGWGWHNIRGMILVDLGRFEEAEEEFRTASEMNPDYLRPRNNMGVICMRRAAMALDRLRKEPDPEKQAPLFREMTRHRQEALDWFGKVLAIDPEDAKARYNRAEIFLSFPPQNLEDARTELERAVEADPEYRKAKSLLEKVRAALAAPPPPGQR